MGSSLPPRRSPPRRSRPPGLRLRACPALRRAAIAPAWPWSPHPSGRLRHRHRHEPGPAVGSGTAARAIPHQRPPAGRRGRRFVLPRREVPVGGRSDPRGSRRPAAARLVRGRSGPHRVEVTFIRSAGTGLAETAGRDRPRPADPLRFPFVPPRIHPYAGEFAMALWNTTDFGIRPRAVRHRMRRPITRRRPMLRPVPGIPRGTLPSLDHLQHHRHRRVQVHRPPQGTATTGSASTTPPPPRSSPGRGRAVMPSSGTASKGSRILAR